MTPRLLLYGASGYTGGLVLGALLERGVRPLVGGRDRRRCEAVARRHGLETRVFGLADSQAVRNGLRGMTAVLHCAGPFEATAAPMIDAALATGCHYLDLTGEIGVIESARRLEPAARGRGVLLLPAAGFMVAPSDALAAHVAGRLPAAVRLRLAVSASSLVSRGSARTMARLADGRIRVLRRGRLLPVATGSLVRSFDFGQGSRRCLGVSWADVATAGHTTGIGEVEAYLQVGTAQEAWLRSWGGILAPLVALPPWSRALDAGLSLLPPGPTPAARSRERRTIVVEAEDDGGRIVASRLHTPDAYTATALVAAEIAVRVLEGGARPGFHTPAGLWGAELVSRLPGFVREDLSG